jgi:hypothetical protein
MKIAIISDVHDNIPNLKKVLDYCNEKISASRRIEKIICCGDLASIETLEYLNDNFSGEIYFTFGNMDNDYLKSYHFEKLDSSTRYHSLGMTYVYKKTKIFKEEGEAEINGKKIAFVHFPRIAKGLCRSGRYDIVFYGHTHKPWEENIDECKMLNPGTVAGQFYPATFAAWDTETNKFELIRVDQLK